MGILWRRKESKSAEEDRFSCLDWPHWLNVWTLSFLGLSASAIQLTFRTAFTNLNFTDSFISEAARIKRFVFHFFLFTLVTRWVGLWPHGKGFRKARLSAWGLCLAALANKHEKGRGLVLSGGLSPEASAWLFNSRLESIYVKCLLSGGVFITHSAVPIWFYWKLKLGVWLWWISFHFQWGLGRKKFLATPKRQDDICKTVH